MNESTKKQFEELNMAVNGYTKRLERLRSELEEAITSDEYDQIKQKIEEVEKTLSITSANLAVVREQVKQENDRAVDASVAAEVEKVCAMEVIARQDELDMLADFQSLFDRAAKWHERRSEYWKANEKLKEFCKDVGREAPIFDFEYFGARRNTALGFPSGWAWAIDVMYFYFGRFTKHYAAIKTEADRRGLPAVPVQARWMRDNYLSADELREALDQVEAGLLQANK